jgi:transcriptional regulator with XRE-family HTH domain
MERNDRAQDGVLQRAVGRAVRQIRLDRTLSQEELADELGVHRTYMGGVERGERNLTLRSVERLARGLGVDPLLLLAGEVGEARGEVAAG